LEEPIQFRVPLFKRLVDELETHEGVTCVSKEDDADKWQPLNCEIEKDLSVEPSDEDNPHYFHCCTSHLSRFTVLNLPVKDPSKIWVVIIPIAVIFAILGVVGSILDRKKKLLFSPRIKLQE